MKLNRTSTGRSAKGASLKKVGARKMVPREPIIQYVLPIGNGWVVKSSNQRRFMVISDSKAEAVALARNLAKTRNSELIVHGKTGCIEITESYAIRR